MAIKHKILYFIYRRNKKELKCYKDMQLEINYNK